MSYHIIKRFPLLFISKQRYAPAAILIINRHSHINHPGHKPHKRSIEVLNELPDTYVDEPEYPPIKPKYPPGYWSTDMKPFLAWHYYDEGQKFHSLKTIQERLSVMAYLNIQATVDDIGVSHMRHYPLFLLSALPTAAQSREQRQYITKTHLETIDINNLPKINDDKVNQELFEQIKAGVIDCIRTNIHKKQPNNDLNKLFIDKDAYKAESQIFEENLKSLNEKSSYLIDDILSRVTDILGSNEKYSFLKNAYYGRNVSIEAYWKRHGYEETNAKGCVFPDRDVIRFQFRDKASYQIKTDRPLKPLFKLNEKNYDELKIPQFNYHPSTHKIFADHTLPMQVPGHWYGDTREFNFLTVYNSTNLAIIEKKYGNEEVLPSLEAMAITTAHAELTAQAYYLGFSMWKDLTYPLLGQFLFTDGQNYAFSKYQLNTLQLWNKAVPLKNVSYVTKPEKLFEYNKEGTDIELFNDNVLWKLIDTLTEKTVSDSNEIIEKYSQLDFMIGGTALRPYLSIQDFEKQLSQRRKLLAISLYELVKYDRPATYLNIHNNAIPKGSKPKFTKLYNYITFEYRDIVRDYYPRDYYGFELVKRMLKKSQAYRKTYWDLLDPVYEWATIPPPHTNNVKRDIKLPTF